MNCREAAEKIDLGEARWRVWLHVLHCRGCRMYRRATRILGELTRKAVAPERLEKLNEDLVSKFGR